jgi:hypothetical protein
MAGLGRKVFTAGDVLTASDVQNYLMDQTVMNFAGTAARSSAIATPTEGMTTYNQTTKQLETYNGSAYVGMSGLQLIKKQTIGSGVSSVNVTSAFSATYTNYKIIVSGGASSTNANLLLRVGNPGTGFYGAFVGANFSDGTPFSTGTNNAANWNNAGVAYTTGLHLNCELHSPFLTTFTSCQGSFFNSIADTGTFTGMLNNAISYTDLTISPSTGTLTGGTIYVYGYGT